MSEHSDTIKVVGDSMAMGAVLGSLIGFLPAIAALFTIIWTGIRIWESHTVREWRGKEPYAQ
jgi:hypothetical protein